MSSRVVGAKRVLPRDFFKDEAVVGRRVMPGTRVLDFVELRKPVSLCHLCKSKLDYRKANYAMLKDEQDLPQLVIATCKGCDARGGLCFRYVPRESFRESWGPRFHRYTR